MNDQSDAGDDKIKRARALYLDGQPLEAIAATLEATADWVRNVLGLDNGEAKKTERPAPAPARPSMDPRFAAAALANELLRQGTPIRRGIDMLSIDHDPRPIAPGGGKCRDGSPARMPLRAAPGLALSVPARRRLGL